MEFVLELGSIQKAMKLMNSVAHQNTDEVIGQVLIDARDTGEVILLCNNESLSLTHLITGCEVKNPGVVCVSCGKLSSFLSAFAPLEEDSGVKDVKFKALKNDLSITLKNFYSDEKSSTHKLKLRFFPTGKIFVPPPFLESKFKINSAILRLALAKVYYAIDPKSIRSFLRGINLNFTDKFINFAGTDAQILSEYKTTNTSSHKEGSYIIEHKFIAALRKILDADSDISFNIEKGKIQALMGTTTLHGSLIIGEEFPPYETAFDNYTNEITIDKNVLLDSFVPFLNTLDPEDHNRLTINIKDSKMYVSSSYAESECTEDIDLEEDFIIDVNGRFLLSTISAIMDDLLHMRFSNSNGVLIFDSAQFGNQRALLTPIRRR